jgi:SAM-dependent methyltransferase
LLATCETDGIFPYIQKYMPAPSKVLESGCGAGRYVKYLADRGWDVIGLEWDQEAVDMIKAYWPEAKAVQGDSANSPFAENTFDGIISLGVIEHWIDGPSAPLHDIYRVLKPGAYAIVTAPCLNRGTNLSIRAKQPKTGCARAVLNRTGSIKNIFISPILLTANFLSTVLRPANSRRLLSRKGLSLLSTSPSPLSTACTTSLTPRAR